MWNMNEREEAIMRTHRSCCLAVFALVVVFGCGQDPGSMSGKDLAEWPIEDFMLETIDGEEIMLSDYLEENVVLLDFSGTWRPRCTAAVPTIQRLHEAYGNSVTIIGIYDRRSADALPDYIEKHGIEYTVVVDTKGEVADKYRIKSFPTFVVIGTDGAAKYYGPDVNAAARMVDKGLTR